jgi:hypothetical protein
MRLAGSGFAWRLVANRTPALMKGVRLVAVLPLSRA